ncbi:MAG: ATP-binding protein [Pseudomonadaceae bacterium]|nr:ATP-binding protein [Pseudomonadaceae bacterium]
MTSPVEFLAGLVVGVVESVAPDEISVLLGLDTPQSTAFNAGSPAAFPRLNSYVLVPNEAGATVCFVSWMGVERAIYPKRRESGDLGLVDLPFPARKMMVNPIGTLTNRRDRNTGKIVYELSRGVVAFSSVGDQVLIPTPEQVAAIVGANDADRRVKIGTSPMAADAPILVDPDKLFGRHLAVLGNTGSGKSCSVAGLIRWSLEAASAQRAKDGREGFPNARFIVLDPNGEYAKSFSDIEGGVRLFRVPPVQGTERPLNVPAWLWNGHEWGAVANAQPGVQRPLLFQGIRELKSGMAEGAPRDAVIRRYLTSYSIRITDFLMQGIASFSGSAKARFDCARFLESVAADTTTFAAEVTDEQDQFDIRVLSEAIQAVIESRRSGAYFNDFRVADLEGVRAKMVSIIERLPELAVGAPIGEDIPSYFDVDLLADHLDRIATEQGGNLAGFISTLGLRIRGMLADQQLGEVITSNPPVVFSDWLENYVGGHNGHNGPIAVIDLSLVPSEIVHVVVAVLGRLVFESLQRYRRAHPDGSTLPTVMVLEEAHTFVKKGWDDDSSSAAKLCRETFEKIAREGRKFGLGLVLSSQRPSELSPTILAQCNTFLLHRIVNDSDQDLVRRLVPDNIGGLLRELPSLPSRQAILLGWATPIPVLVEMSDLPKKHRPWSDDPDYWAVWTGKSERNVDWVNIAADWAGATRHESE